MPDTEDLEQLLRQAAEDGITVRWLEDGGLEVRGGTREQRRAIGSRKAELAACPDCGEVIVAGTTHCEDFEIVVQKAITPERKRAGPFTIMWGICPSCGDSTVVAAEVPPTPCTACVAAALAEKAPGIAVHNAGLPGLKPWRTCASCFTKIRGEPSSAAMCPAPGCGSTRWIESCSYCGRDAVPGTTHCANCA
jgi:hypothetical protein